MLLSKSLIVVTALIAQALGNAITQPVTAKAARSHPRDFARGVEYGRLPMLQRGDLNEIHNTASIGLPPILPAPELVCRLFPDRCPLSNVAVRQPGSFEGVNNNGNEPTLPGSGPGQQPRSKAGSNRPPICPTSDCTNGGPAFRPRKEPAPSHSTQPNSATRPVRPNTGNKRRADVPQPTGTSAPEPVETGTAAPPPMGTGTAAPPPVGTGTAAPPPVGTGTAAPPPVGTGTGAPKPKGTAAPQRGGDSSRRVKKTKTQT